MASFVPGRNGGVRLRPWRARARRGDLYIPLGYYRSKYEAEKAEEAYDKEHPREPRGQRRHYV